jgi:hypothetical protein
VSVVPPPPSLPFSSHRLAQLAVRMKELGTQTQQGYIRMKDLKGMELVSSANRSVSLPSRDLISSRLSLLCLALTASHSSSSPQARTKRCSSSPSLPSSLTSGTTLCMALSRHCPQLPEAHPPFQGPPIDRNDGKRGERGRCGDAQLEFIIRAKKQNHVLIMSIERLVKRSVKLLWGEEVVEEERGAMAANYLSSSLPYSSSSLSLKSMLECFEIALWR